MPVLKVKYSTSAEAYFVHCVWVYASILALKIVGKDTIQKAKYITQSVSESLG